MLRPQGGSTKSYILEISSFFFFLPAFIKSEKILGGLDKTHGQNQKDKAHVLQDAHSSMYLLKGSAAT